MEQRLDRAMLPSFAFDRLAMLETPLLVDEGQAWNLGQAWLILDQLDLKGATEVLACRLFEAGSKFGSVQLLVGKTPQGRCEHDSPFVDGDEAGISKNGGDVLVFSLNPIDQTRPCFQPWELVDVDQTLGGRW